MISDDSSTASSQEFIVVGMEDGSVHVYDYTRNHNKSHSGMLFNVKRTEHENSKPYDMREPGLEPFCQSLKMHSASINVLVKNPWDGTQFITGCKDGDVFVYHFLPNNGEQFD